MQNKTNPIDDSVIANTFSTSIYGYYNFLVSRDDGLTSKYFHVLFL
jgi:hypothetical protein